MNKNLAYGSLASGLVLMVLFMGFGINTGHHDTKEYFSRIEVYTTAQAIQTLVLK
jgi:hypothetical protein